MKEITILSGKGGTGKTSITAALASLAQNAVFCDSDVDAADLHLILQPQIEYQEVFEGAYIAKIHEENCTNCGICEEHCHFDAIHQDTRGQYFINPFQCEGCRLCERVCPTQTITSTRSTHNFWYISNTRFGKMVHAKMGAGEENSGKLVTQVRNKAKEIAKAQKADFILNDGPPGIGCPVISSLSGTQQVLLVIEPTKSGLHDIQRLIALIRDFNIPMMSIINKYDINMDMSLKVEDYLNKEKIPLIERIPFDTRFVKAMIEEKSVVEYDPNSEISQKIKHIWEALTENFKKIQ
jgi:MinD superfamily P-loop ATPase